MLIALALIAALAVTAGNIALIRLTGRVGQLQHQVCLLEHRPPSCHAP